MLYPYYVALWGTFGGASLPFVHAGFAMGPALTDCLWLLGSMYMMCRMVLVRTLSYSRFGVEHGMGRGRWGFLCVGVANE